MQGTQTTAAAPKWNPSCTPRPTAPRTNRVAQYAKPVPRVLKATPPPQPSRWHPNVPNKLDPLLHMRLGRVGHAGGPPGKARHLGPHNRVYRVEGGRSRRHRVSVDQRDRSGRPPHPDPSTPAHRGAHRRGGSSEATQTAALAPASPHSRHPRPPPPPPQSHFRMQKRDARGNVRVQGRARRDVAGDRDSREGWKRKHTHSRDQQAGDHYSRRWRCTCTRRPGSRRRPDPRQPTSQQPRRWGPRRQPPLARNRLTRDAPRPYPPR